ncbi:MAG: HK97 family phage prohead protease [bacterium]
MPFGHDCEYATFDECVADNADKEDPEAFCAALEEATKDQCEGQTKAGVMPDDIRLEERKAAAAKRAEQTGTRDRPRITTSRHSPGAGVITARVQPFPAKGVRAKLVKRNGQDRYHLEGHASVTDVPYEMWDMFGPYEEIIDSGAFDQTLDADPDVAFLVNHRGVTMARTTNGNLELAMDDEGLAVDAYTNPKRQDVSDLVTAIEDEDITEMSFAFMLEQGWWSDDFMTFKITQVDIDRGDVSAVNYGANPYTDIAARAGMLMADVDRLPPVLGREAVRRLLARSDLELDDLFTRMDLARRYDEARAAVDDPVGGGSTSAPAGRSIAHIEALLEE